METNKKHVLYLRILGICLILVWMYVIFRFSAQSGTESSGASRAVVDVFYTIIEKITGKNLQASISAEHFLMVEFVFRKLAHMFIYFVLSVNIMLVLFTFPIHMLNRCLLTILTCFLYACSDELHQLFVDGRGASFTDALIDTGGAVLGVIFALIIFCIIYTIYFSHQRKKLQSA